MLLKHQHMTQNNTHHHKSNKLFKKTLNSIK